MKRRPCYLLIFISLSLFTLFILTQSSQQRYKSNQPFKPAQHNPNVDAKLNLNTHRQTQRFISYFPHGDLMDQVNSLRNGLRLALDTNRTLILPHLRLGTPLNDWVPFEDMARRYEAQDKTQYSSACTMPMCRDLDSWTEIPWSTLFDLTFLKNHSVNVVERINFDWKHGGGWVDDPSYVVVDPLTYWENGTHFNTHEKQPLVKQKTLWNWMQQPSSDDKMPLPLEHRRISTHYLQQLDKTTLIQFGSLAQKTTIATSHSVEEVGLLDDLAKRLVPNRLTALNQAADSIIKVLGGSQGYTSFHLHLSTLIQREVSLLQDGMDKEPVESSSATTLDSATFLEMMNAIVFELLGEIPISQALSASLPLQPSRLLDHLHDNDSADDKLLDVCIDYRKHVDPRYPIVYLVTDTAETPDRASMAPLVKLFPCLFTRNDLQKWNPLPFGWSSVIPGAGMDDTLVNYDVLLGPFLDILVADESYSFLEMPLTPLSMFITKQHHHK
ncbi:hypothetical protein BC941DRAFT_502066 [Chlamydoabsidia padenii]|nr:hypothetical protein BC941DRAFT_502066 [Chlamydoabsidia padenii]